MASYPYTLTVTNPGAETGNTSGWTDVVGSLASVTSLAGTSPHAGSRFFKAGASASTHCYQDIALPSDVLTDVDLGVLNSHLSLYQAGQTSDSDTGQPYLEFYNGSSVIIGVRHLGEAFNGTDNTWVLKHLMFQIPASTRTVRVGFLGVRGSGTDLNAYFDDVSLLLKRSELIRRQVGLLDYFLPGTREFTVADWTASSGLTITRDGTTGRLLLAPGTTNPCRRTALLNTVAAYSGGYSWAELSRSTSNLGVQDVYTSITDQTPASEDNQGARLTSSGGTFPLGGIGFSGNNEHINGVETVYGSGSANLGSGTVNHIFTWVEPGVAAPACLARRYRAASGDTDNYTHGGPMSRELVGKPGIGVGSSGSNVALNVYQFWALRDRYLKIKGQTTGRIAIVRSAAGATRFSATVDGAKVGAVDLFGDLTPLSSYDVCIFETDGVTPVDCFTGPVWPGDILSPPLPVADFSLVATGLTARLTDRSQAFATGATIVAWAWRLWLTSAPGSILQTSAAQNPMLTVPAAGTYTIDLVATDSNGTESDEYTRTQEFGPGTSEPPYDLPTMRAAGRILIRLQRSIDWTGVTGVVTDTDGGFWLDYNKLPKPGGGTECRWKSREVTNGPDQNVRTLRLRLILEGAAGSLSSGATGSSINRIQPGGGYSAALFGAREVLIQVPLGSPDSTDPEDWLPRFHGYLDDPLASSSGIIEVNARDVASRLQFAYRGRGVWIGTEGEELTLGDAIQAVLDVTTQAGLWPLKVAEGLDWGIDAFQMESVNDVLEFINTMARNRGAVVKWWPDTDTGRFQLTLFVLQTDKDEPDLTFGPNDWKAGEHGSDTSNIRTERSIEYYPPGATEPVAISRSATPEQRDEYGLKSVVIGTDQTKHIKTAIDAEAMLDYVDAAVLLPATVGSRIISPSDPTIDVNTLLEFEPDSALSTETIQQYVGEWSEREEISESGEIEDSITVKTRDVPTGTVAAWLAGIAGTATDTVVKLPPTWRVLKWVRQDPVYLNYTGTAYWQLEPHGLAILESKAQTKLPGRAWSERGAATRGPGDYSEYFQRALGNFEYEMDVDLDSGGLLSSIAADVLFEGLTKPQTLFEVNLDADNDPEVSEVIVTGLLARVKGDDDSLSLHVVGPPGSGYSSSFDVSDPADHTFTIPVPGATTWELNAYSRNTITADPIDKVSPPYPFTVTNSGEPSIAILPEAPVDGSGVVSITQVQATSAPTGYGLKISMSYQTYPYAGGAGVTFGEIDITNQLSPSPLGQPLPTTPTTYSFSTDLVRDDAGADATVLMQFRVEILNASGISGFDSLNNPSLTASWGI